MFPCICCQVNFDTSLGQRTHMRSEWHRYNIKRKAANLAPVELSIFEEKVVKRVEPEPEKEQFECDTCQKSFKTENQYKNHLLSKKHLMEKDSPTLKPKITNGTKPLEKNWKQLIVNAENEEEIDKILAEKSKLAKKLSELDCLFCPIVSNTLDDNLQHMAKQHSFFVPAVDQVKDLPELLRYLGDKISIANICIYCNGSGKMMHSLESVRAHMVMFLLTRLTRDIACFLFQKVVMMKY